MELLGGRADPCETVGERDRRRDLCWREFPPRSEAAIEARLEVAADDTRLMPGWIELCGGVVGGIDGGQPIHQIPYGGEDGEMLVEAKGTGEIEINERSHVTEAVGVQAGTGAAGLVHGRSGKPAHIVGGQRRGKSAFRIGVRPVRAVARRPGS